MYLTAPKSSGEWVMSYIVRNCCVLPAGESVANLADVLGTAFGIALARTNLPVVPMFALLSGMGLSMECSMWAPACGFQAWPCLSYASGSPAHMKFCASTSDIHTSVSKAHV